MADHSGVDCFTPRRRTEDSSVTKASGTDLRTWKFPIEDATLDRLVRPRCGCINGSLNRQQALADYVRFDRGQNHNGDLATRKILLVTHGLVSGEEDFEAVVLGSSQKLAVFQPRPALVAYREYFVTPEMAPQPVRKGSRRGGLSRNGLPAYCVSKFDQPLDLRGGEARIVLMNFVERFSGIVAVDDSIG